jgi:putative transposase
MVHDHDSIYSDRGDLALTTMGLRVLKTPLAAPQANAFCERLIGTARRACLDFMIPLNERHLRRVLADCVTRYNQARPHANLGPDIPDRPENTVVRMASHVIDRDHRVISRPILGGLHHEYRLEPIAA